MSDEASGADGDVDATVTIADRHLDALRAAARAGAEIDGLRVDHSEEGYAVSVDGTAHEGLDEEGLAAVARDHPEHVDNLLVWRELAPDADDRRAFLRWLEGADERPVEERYEALRDGLVAEWGQLRVRVHLGDGGGRSYEVRHAADADADPAELADHDDPLEARRLAKRDEDGRYRPLKTAPSLPTGWRFPDLDPRELTDLVDHVYPATVANWHREREGELDVTHWREAAERQTGIYDVVAELDREAVEWVAEACCVDSQCLKRREWEYEDGDDLAVDGGDGQFPCREPCSLVIAAARKWTRLEDEEPRTYEFELTPSEKEQLEAVVDAVADGRAGDIREADVSEGANRYRVRYLRAKLFDEDGHLPATDESDDR